MTKFFSIAAVIGTALFMNAQQLLSDNFNNYNLATIINQGGPTYTFTGGTYADYMVVATGNASKGLAISCPANETRKTTRPVYWYLRNSTNRVIQIEYDFFTGPISTSTNATEVSLDSSTNMGTTFNIGLIMNQGTKAITGITTLVGGVRSYIPLDSSPIVLPANTWVRLGIACNFSNGTYVLNGPGFNYTASRSSLIQPNTVNFNIFSPDNNSTASSVSTFDNILIQAVAAPAFLGTNETNISESQFSIFPNPSTDYINIKINTKYAEVYIYDASGIRTNAKVENNQVDVRNLTQGVYVLGVKTEKGLLTQKFIKK